MADRARRKAPRHARERGALVSRHPRARRAHVPHGRGWRRQERQQTSAPDAPVTTPVELTPKQRQAFDEIAYADDPEYLALLALARTLPANGQSRLPRYRPGEKRDGVYSNGRRTVHLQRERAAAALSEWRLPPPPTRRTTVTAPAAPKRRRTAPLPEIAQLPPGSRALTVDVARGVVMDRSMVLRPDLVVDSRGIVAAAAVNEEPLPSPSNEVEEAASVAVGGLIRMLSRLVDSVTRLADREPLPAPIVNVTSPPVHVAPPAVHVAAPTVNVRPAKTPDVHVHVPETKPRAVRVETRGGVKRYIPEDDA